MNNDTQYYAPIKCIISLIFFLLLSVTCKQKEPEKKVEDVKVERISLSELEKFLGVYQYFYEYPAKNLSEDHFILLEKEKNEIKGYYYGTSDDFDRTREGYLPGFFVAEMKNMRLHDGNFSFSLFVKDEEVFDKAISLEYRSSIQLPKGKFKIWKYGIETHQREYKGKIEAGKITLYFDPEDPIETERLFKKIK
ncbi:MAG: hypothetical protein L6Q54_13545 [Leptospiraceae bacterium]|nr:hypothetical protein [Leptospiraceae bacterium]MCK6382258.1 hypothetical protein [Leptospiraceae bacterium]NUM42706.1 hypothetical protein [Leptospiraceae bacterium]